VIVVAVRWYLRYGLSYRDVEELLAERGIEVDHVTVYRWVQRFTRLLADAARSTRHSPGDRWFVDETYVKVSGVWRYVYRAVDQHGQVIDVLLRTRRDAAARTTAGPTRDPAVMCRLDLVALVSLGRPSVRSAVPPGSQSSVALPPGIRGAGGGTRLACAPG
jgi:hypothetical protein